MSYSTTSRYSPATPCIVPVMSFIGGVGDAVRAYLQASATPAGELFRKNAIQVVDVPLPRLVGNKQDMWRGANMECPGSPKWDLTPEQLKIMQDAEVIVMDAASGGRVLLAPHEHLPPELPPVFTNLKLVQGTYNGVDVYLDQLQKNKESGKGVISPQFTVSRAGGIVSGLIGQYVATYVTMLERKLLLAKAYQEQGVYANLEMANYRWPGSVTIGILGLGDIGRGIGRMLRAAGHRVVGYKRRINMLTDEEKQAADRVTDQLDDVLGCCDYLVSILPSTAATRFMLTPQVLDKCRARKPVFINVGRGDVISEKVLLDELNNEKDGAFSFAVLDVFEQEPLPSSSELYKHPRVLLTPHSAGRTFPEDIGILFETNMNLFLRGEQVTYAVDWSLGY